MNDQHDRADAALSAVCCQLEMTCPPPRVGVPRDGDTVWIDPSRYRLGARELRQDIATYLGRLRASRFTAVASAAIAASQARLRIDLSAEATPEQVAATEHLMTLRAAAVLHSEGVEGLGSLTGGADVLWQPEHYGTSALLAVSVWDLLPRADIAVLNASSVDFAYRAAKSRLAPATLARWQQMWRQALAGRPAARRNPRVMDWLQLGRQWIDLHQDTFGDVSLQVVPYTPLTGADRFGFRQAPSDDGHQLALELAAAAQEVVRRDAGMAAEIGDHPHRPGIAPFSGSVDDAAGGAGGAVVSGQRTILWRNPSEADRRNLRIFRSGLTVAGHRAPAPAPTPVRYPSGRLNPRQLVARAGQISTGQPVTAAPWTALKPVARTAQLLRLGVIVDVSATMRPWTEVAAPLGWAAAHAVAQRGGQHTLWGFGGEAFPIVADGVAPPQVPVISDPGSGSAGCGQALTAAADMLTGAGAGLLIVITDGLLPDTVDVQDAVDDVLAAGFAVVWVMPQSATSGFRPRRVRVIDDRTPATLAAAITETSLAVLAGSAR